MDFTTLNSLETRELEVLDNAIKALIEARKMKLDGANRETSALSNLKTLNALVSKRHK